MKKKRGGRILPWLMLAVSFAGFCIFYLAPFAVSFLYSLTDDPIHRAFAGAANYIGLFRNVYFVRGLKSTLCFIAVCIPLHMALSLAAALIVHGWKRGSEWIGLIFLLPLAIPSAASAFFWQKFFGQEGALNHILALFRAEGPDWLNSKYGMPVMAVIFRKIIKEKYVVTKTETQNSLTEYGFLRYIRPVDSIGFTGLFMPKNPLGVRGASLRLLACLLFICRQPSVSGAERASAAGRWNYKERRHRMRGAALRRRYQRIGDDEDCDGRRKKNSIGPG